MLLSNQWYMMKKFVGNLFFLGLKNFLQNYKKRCGPLKRESFFPSITLYIKISSCLLSQYRVFWDPEDSFNLSSLATLMSHHAKNGWRSWLGRAEPLISRNRSELHWLSYFLPSQAKLFRPVLFWRDINSSEFLFVFSTWYRYRSVPDLFAKF